MSVYNKYTVNQNFIPGLPQEPFRNGKPEGVVMHATAVFNDTPEGERNYETQHFDDAFVHTFSAYDEILQVASYSYIAYHCCHSGNLRYLGNEVCQTHDHNLFLQGYDRWVWLAARQLIDLKLPVIDGQTLLSHAQVSQDFHESNHDDPCGFDCKSGYLGEHNKTWQDVVNDVTNYYNQMKLEMEVKKLDKDAGQKVINMLGACYVLTNDEKVQEVFHFAADAIRDALGIPKQNQ